jgi:transposase
MQYYVGLDVSQRNTAICVVDHKGKVVCEGKTLTLPSDIFGWPIRVTGDVAPIEAVCIEAGAMSSWLYKELSNLGLPMVCVEAYQAHAFLKTSFLTRLFFAGLLSARFRARKRRVKSHAHSDR